MERSLSLLSLFISNTILNRITLQKKNFVLNNAIHQKNNFIDFKNNKNKFTLNWFRDFETNKLLDSHRPLVWDGYSYHNNRQSSTIWNRCDLHILALYTSIQIRSIENGQNIGTYFSHSYSNSRNKKVFPPRGIRVPLLRIG